MDSLGNAYVTGYTSSTNFPTVAGAFQSSLRGSSDLFLIKLAATPAFYITLSKGTYVNGDMVTATEFRPVNPNPSPTAVRLRIWLQVPTLGDVTLMDIGADGNFLFPANMNINLGPILLLPVSAEFPPKGDWGWISVVTDPVTGALMNVDLNPFTVQ